MLEYWGRVFKRDIKLTMPCKYSNDAVDRSSSICKILSGNPPKELPFRDRAYLLININEAGP